MHTFLGVWEFDPTSTHYELGSPPQSGTYEIQQEDATWLRFTAKWVAADGKSYEVSYRSRADGEAHPFTENPAAADFLRSQFVDSRTLDSLTYKNDQLIAHARRVVTLDGASMGVTQAMQANGAWFHNFARYHKVSSTQPLT